MFCEKCGNKILKSTNFCNKCGNAVQKNTEVSNELTTDSLIDTKFKRGVYKLDNDDVAGAEEIFEELALTYNSPTAWLYIGGIKLNQLDSGKGTVEQALNCFVRAAELCPSLKGQYQETYCNLSIEQIQNLCNSYLATKKELQESKKGKFWNGVLLGVSVAYGSQRSSKSNNVFRGVAGVGGSAYALNKMNINSKKIKSAEEIQSFLVDTMRELINGVKSYCSDNPQIYENFLNKVNHVNYLLPGLHLI